MSHDSLHPVALEDEPMARRREEGVVAPALDDLVHARPADAFAWLGPHRQPEGGASCAFWCPTRVASR
jgi:1,4-alpha-glucan branching enzyme